MNDSLEDLQQETSQINARLKKLKASVGTAEFYALPFLARSAFEEQIRALDWYKQTLVKRSKFLKAA